MTRHTFEDYYIQQAKTGNGLPIFIGGQRGRGLGGILSGLARMIVPVLKKGGKALLKEGVKAGTHIIGDVLEGENFKTSVKKRTKQSGSRLLKKAADQIVPGEVQGGPPGQRGSIKRRSTGGTVQSARKQRRVNTQRPKDIFDR